MTIAINEYETVCNDAVSLSSVPYVLWKAMEDLGLEEPIAAASFEPRP
jgi:hypothetical protein